MSKAKKAKPNASPKVKGDKVRSYIKRALVKINYVQRALFEVEVSPQYHGTDIQTRVDAANRILRKNREKYGWSMDGFWYDIEQYKKTYETMFEDTTLNDIANIAFAKRFLNINFKDIVVGTHQKAKEHEDPGKMIQFMRAMNSMEKNFIETRNLDKKAEKLENKGETPRDVMKDPVTGKVIDITPEE